MPKPLQTDFQYLRPAKLFMDSRFAAVPASMRLDESADMAFRKGVAYLLVVKEKAVLGAISVNSLRDVLEAVGRNREITLGEVAETNYVVVPEDLGLFEVITKIRDRQAAFALVLDNGETSVAAEEVKGVIAEEQIGEATLEATDLY